MTLQQSTLEGLVHLLIPTSRLTLLTDSKVGFGGFGEVCLGELDKTSKVAVKQLRITQDEETSINIHVAKANVLVSDQHDAVLCDFGLAAFTEDSTGSGLTTSGLVKGSIRYMSPELFEESEAKLTLESDIWAWACTIFQVSSLPDGSQPSVDKRVFWLQIITNVIPYLDRRRDQNVIAAAVRGISPGSMELLGDLAQKVDIPSGSILTTLQTLIPECWVSEPQKRPASSNILERLKYSDLRSPDLPSAQPPKVEVRRDGAPSVVRNTWPPIEERLAAALAAKLCTELNGDYLTIEGRPFAAGAFSDVYSGRWEPPDDPKYPQGIDVAIKVLRLGGFWNDPNFAENCKLCWKHLGREVFVWQRVNHPRITPFIGYIQAFKDDIVPCIVSARRQTDLATYITTINPQADRLRLLCQALEGLIHLHTFSPSPIIHLDIKPEHILVTDEGTVELCGFQCSKLLDGVATGFTTGPSPGGSYPYMAPETLMGVVYGQLTPGADIYAMGSTILYVLSGRRAWYKIRSIGLLTIAIIRGDLPKWVDHPMEGSDEAIKKTWELLARCWKMLDNERPSAQEVLDELIEIEALGGHAFSPQRLHPNNGTGEVENGMHSTRMPGITAMLKSTLDELAHLLINPSRLFITNGSEIGSGGYGEVCLATLDGVGKVAVKQLRIMQVQGTKVRVAMGIESMGQINHPNILKLVGYYLSGDYGCAQLVSSYMENGNITEYMKGTQAEIGVRLVFVSRFLDRLVERD
ncbi:hypothetical protein FRC01_000226 [Tulasnella sp. 417]|nr:hypothetical protein FRC01_000226 [Tulasnella sp. 417]